MDVVAAPYLAAALLLVVALEGLDPAPIVDHDAERKEALARLQAA